MRIAVYCSAKDSIPQTYKQMGYRLGEWIGAQGHTLVYGGATGGLMTCVSDAAKTAGARVIGVIPARIKASKRQATNCDELIHVDSMATRKAKMREIADCFVCLPGSYGTLDEMMDVIASGTVGEHHKPIYILNIHGFYDDLQRQIERMKTELFIPAEESYKPIFVETQEDLYGYISEHQRVVEKNIKHI